MPAPNAHPQQTLQTPTQNTDDPSKSAPSGRQRIRLRSLLMLRWLAIAGQTFTILIVQTVLGFHLDLAPILAIISASAWVNLYFLISQPTQRFLKDTETAGHLAFDVVQLSLLIAFTGGMNNPFVVLMGAPVAIAFTALRARHAMIIAGLSLLAAIAVWTVSAPLPWRPDEEFDPPRLFEFGLAMAFVTSTGFVGVFAWRLSHDAQRMSEALFVMQNVLSREQRLSALGSLAAAAAHELGTPLGTIQITAKEMARALPRDSELREDAQLLVSQAERCRDILRQLSQRGEAHDMVHAQLSAQQLVDEVIAPIQSLAEADRVSITVDLIPENGAPAQPPQLRRLPELIYALTNYVENAVDFAASEVVITCRWTTTQLSIEIADDGPGFSNDIISELGQPYVSQRAPNDPHGGMGLGFFIAKTFVERTGGRLRFGNTKGPNSGAYVHASWPLASITAPDH